MKVVLDECLPRKLKRLLSAYDVSTVPEMGWAGKRNGVLLKLMEPVVDVFITIDGNLQYQQKLAQFQIALMCFQLPTTQSRQSVRWHLRSSRLFNRSSPVS